MLTADPIQGVIPYIWQCYDGLKVQQWLVHPDGHIELGCTGLCLYLKEGNDGANDVLQLWDCIPRNKNQEFDIVENSSDA